jgi:hypothetical protein
MYRVLSIKKKQLSGGLTNKNWRETDVHCVQASQVDNGLLLGFFVLPQQTKR